MPVIAIKFYYDKLNTSEEFFGTTSIGGWFALHQFFFLQFGCEIDTTIPLHPLTLVEKKERQRLFYQSPFPCIPSNQIFPSYNTCK